MSWVSVNVFADVHVLDTVSWMMTLYCIQHVWVNAMSHGVIDRRQAVSVSVSASGCVMMKGLVIWMWMLTGNIPSSYLTSRQC
jgi:hypothetical protein